MGDSYSSFAYQVGGSLDINAPSYVTRQADFVFYQWLKAGEFCYVLNSRQMGKSSLRVRTMKRLEAEGTVCVFIDLTGIGSQDVTPERWYAGIVQSLVSGCQLSKKIDWRKWWREQRELMAPMQRLNLFIEEILLVEIEQNIVIFIDEIDYILRQSFSGDDFFALIKYCFQQREVNAAYKRLTFALLGVATPSELMRDRIQTPFNIGRAIDLHGFKLEEVQPLIAGLQNKVTDPVAFIKEILEWSGGQPFLTQKLCSLLMQELVKGNALTVEQVVRSRVLDNWESQDEPEHLKTIRDRICYRDERRVGRLLGLYQKILQFGEIAADGSPEQVELRLSGLVVERQGKLKVYNRIYEAVFNPNWVQQKLTRLRPYAKEIDAWLLSKCQDRSQLLQGEVLQDALAWASDKSLGDWDYKFLGASQDLAKQQTQTALETVEQANHLLATAKQEAQQAILQQRLGWGKLSLIVLSVTIPIWLLRLGGLLQGLELSLFDQFFRWRPLEATDNRIVVITVDESDIQAAGKYPLPDGVLAQAIANIKVQNPRAIGLDIFRNLPVEPGHAELNQIFQSTPNLFAIENVVDDKIAAPAILSQPINRFEKASPAANSNFTSQGRQVGFADQVEDPNGEIRRALLTVMPPNQDVRYSLALQLALFYLKAQGITQIEESSGVRLGKALFERFESNDGSYVRASSGGYQILLNYRGNEHNFVTFSLKSVLEKKIPPEQLRDRIVLIGTTAESIKDTFPTPYNGGLLGSPQEMAGVFIHANIISQILSSALDGRPLIRTWTEPMEWLWILLWAGIGTGLMAWLKSPFVIAVGTVGLLGCCYLAFLYGWWLPVVPALLAFLGASLVMLVIANRQRDQLLFRYTLASLLNACNQYPTAARIALQYFKQSESNAHQVIIDQHLQARNDEVQ